VRPSARPADAAAAQAGPRDVRVDADADEHVIAGDRAPVAEHDRGDAAAPATRAGDARTEHDLDAVRER
jgi:hypothetical protein